MPSRRRSMRDQMLGTPGASAPPPGRPVGGSVLLIAQQMSRLMNLLRSANTHARQRRAFAARAAATRQGSAIVTVRILNMRVALGPGYTRRRARSRSSQPCSREAWLAGSRPENLKRPGARPAGWLDDDTKGARAADALLRGTGRRRRRLSQGRGPGRAGTPGAEARRRPLFQWDCT